MPFVGDGRSAADETTTARGSPAGGTSMTTMGVLRRSSENSRWVTSYWKTSKNNRLARYYQLTTAGRHALAEEIESWRFYAEAVDHVINAK